MLRRSAATVAILIAAVVALPGIAQAKFSATGSGNPRINATAIHNATGFAGSCVPNTQGPVTLSWMASPDSFISYAITRSINGGAATTIATLSASTVTYSDNSNAAKKNDVWVYTIRAVVGTNWTTAALSVSMSFPGPAGKC